MDLKNLRPGVAPREVWAWAAFDFANSGYTTVVLTAVFNAYFVSCIAGDAPWATFAWTSVVAASNLLSMIAMPAVAAHADMHASKKRWLLVMTVLAVVATALLATTGPGTIVWASLLVIVSNFAYNVGESVNSAFLPEIAREEAIGKVSGWGWAFGYCGGLTTLGGALVLVIGAEKFGLTADGAVRGAMLVTAAVFALAATPVFMLLRERAEPRASAEGVSTGVAESLREAVRTLREIPAFPDFGILTLCGFLYQCGVSVVITLSAVYAAAVMGFETADTILMVFLVNITAAVGAFAFGYVQDRIGHKRALMMTLIVWLAMIVAAALAETRAHFWIAANLAGLAMGSSQSAGRAMVGVFAPAGRQAEFYGLWNLALWMAAVVGPLSYGVITWMSGNNHHLAICSTGLFFVLAILILVPLNVERGSAKAKAAEESSNRSAGGDAVRR